MIMLFGYFIMRSGSFIMWRDSFIMWLSRDVTLTHHYHETSGVKHYRPGFTRLKEPVEPVLIAGPPYIRT